jgi:hypothetical protein
VHVRIDPSGQHTAEVPGLPEASATGATREAAIQQLRCILVDWLRSGRLVSLPVVVPMTLRKPPGWPDNDPLEQEFLAELARMRQEDLERTLREYEEEDRACHGSSSTPTT